MNAALTPAISAVHRRWALIALAVGGFAIGCSEFASMGLLPAVAQDLLASEYASDPQRGIARAGWIISAYALGVVVGAPTVALACARRSQTRLAVVMAVALAVGAALTALAPTFETLVAARFLAGLPHGAYFGVCALVASWMMGPGNQGKGLALALAGLTVANIVGVPAVTWLGQATGWRVAFWVVAAMFALTAVAVLLVVPHQDPHPEASPRREMRALRLPRVWLIMGAAAVGLGGFFAVYSYLAEATTRHASLGPAAVPWVLATAGVGMTLGNWLGGRAADASPHRAIHRGFALYAVALASFGLFSGSAVGMFVTTFLVGVGNSHVVPALQSRLIDVGSPSRLLTASLNHSSFNVGNSLGAVLGGAVIAAGFGYRAPGWAGLVVALAGWAMITWDMHLERTAAHRAM